MNFSLLRKMSASIMASGLLACAGAPVANGLGWNSLRTLFWILATAGSAAGTYNAYTGNLEGNLEAKYDGKDAAWGAGITGFSLYEFVSSYTTNSQLDKVDELDERIERLESASKRTGVRGGNSVKSAVMSQNRPVNQVQYYAPYGQVSQQVQIMNNMNDGRYNF